MQSESVTFHESRSFAIRLWHWLTFITITASLVLVLMGSTFFKMKDNIGMVQAQVERKGGTVTPEQARAVAHEYSDKMWMAHKYVGYGLCFLLLCRVIIEATQPGEEKLRTKIKKALAFNANTPAEKKDLMHYLWVKRGYMIFYLLFSVMALTGLGLAYEDVPMLEPIHDSIKEVHKFTQYLIYSYIVLHLAGVISADMGKYNGLVSGMIHGKNAPRS